MKRRLLSGMLILLTIELMVVLPLLAFIPLGGRLANVSHRRRHLPPRLSLLAVGTPPAVQVEAAYLIDVAGASK